MARSATKDTTEGPLVKLILGFLIPILCRLLFQQLYNTTDTIIVGEFLGVRALAVVGSTGSVNFMIIGFYLGVCSRLAVPIAQKFGEKNVEALRYFVANGGWLATAFAVIMTTTVCLFCRNILRLMQTPGDIIEGAYSYVFVTFLGIPTTYLRDLLSCTLRSLGGSTMPLLFLVLSSVVDAALDLFTTLMLGMGMARAGWVTITVQAVLELPCLFYMKRKYTILKINEGKWKPDHRYMKILCSMGIPMRLQYSVTAVRSVALQTAVNSLDSVAVTAVTAGSKISMFFCCSLDALGSTTATHGGQNVGAYKLDRVGQGLKAGSMIGCVYAVIALGVLFFFGDLIALMFVDLGGTKILRNTK